jgi:peptidoglycan/LPS O-acetylase OafA/YrhL
MLQGFPYSYNIGIGSLGSARPLWTVSIEWWIYILFGILLFFRKIKINPLIIFIFVISFIVSFYNIGGRGSSLTIYWIIGVLLAILYNLTEVRLKISVFIPIFLFIISAFLYRIYVFQQYEMYDVGLAFLLFVILYLLINSPKEISNLFSSKLFSSVSKFLASFSYSLYLVHYSIIVIIRVYYKEDFDYYAILFIFIICNISAYIFYLFFEKNHYKFKYWFKSFIHAD